MPVEEAPIPKELLCNVQAMNLGEDCDLMLVSDGEFWRCPKGHWQGRTDTGLMIREIPDRRISNGRLR